jgi:hypothetical protein
MKNWVIEMLHVANTAVAQETHNQYEPANAPWGRSEIACSIYGRLRAS